jgi:hypothetical protein
LGNYFSAYDPQLKLHHSLILEDDPRPKPDKGLNFRGDRRILEERTSLFRCSVRSRVRTGKMAEEMSGRKPTFCCSKDGLVSKVQSLWLKGTQG